MKIIVCGYMIRHPFAGNLLAFFNYVLGLHRLGHEVAYLEESGWPQSCYNPIDRIYSDDPNIGRRAVEALMHDYGAKVKACYINRETGVVYGANWDKVKSMLKAADLLLNIGGVSWLPEFLFCRRRALVDMDPFFTQIGRFGVEGREHYHAYFSYGANIGNFNCTVPTDGINWIPTVPPVVPEIWQIPQSTRLDVQKTVKTVAPFTTVANWSAYGTVTYNGEIYGQKDVEFLKLIELPKLTSQKLELAISGASAEIWNCMQTTGWSLREGDEVSSDVPTYQSYITGSRGEFSAAKNAYVKTRSGWFSDRSICYLAAGKPVILQDTGFSDWLPTGHGVLSFSSIDEALDCIEKVNEDYPAHCLTAKKVAEKIFGYKAVLPRLINGAFSQGIFQQQ
jgi:hypothetical protein